MLVHVQPQIPRRQTNTFELNPWDFSWCVICLVCFVVISASDPTNDVDNFGYISFKPSCWGRVSKCGEVSWVAFEFKSADIAWFKHLILILEISPMTRDHCIPSSLILDQDQVIRRQTIFWFHGTLGVIEWSSEWTSTLARGSEDSTKTSSKLRRKSYISYKEWICDMLWVDDGLWLGYLYGNFNLKSVFLASSYMVGLSWLCQTPCFSIRRYERQSWNDNIVTCNTEGNDENCVSTETFFVVNLSKKCSPSPNKNRETVQVTGADWRHLLGLFGLNEAEGTPEIQFEEWKVRLRDSQTVYLYNEK